MLIAWKEMTFVEGNKTGELSERFKTMPFEGLLLILMRCY
jgi:hypothetical protein